jgi:5-methylthioadenosine/S-adenosylhomocysteine deaminase
VTEAMPRIVVEADILLEPCGEVREDVAILIEDGSVAAIENRSALSELPADERLTGQGCIALPGLVNAHQHGRADSTIELGVADAPLECWLVSLLAGAAEDPYLRTRRLCTRLASAGITTAVHMHSTIATSAEAYEDELRRVLRGYHDGGIRVVLAAGLRDRGMPVYGDTQAFLDRLPPALRREANAVIPKPLPAEHALAIINTLQHDVRAGRYPTATVAYGPAGPPWCSDDLLAQVAHDASTAGAIVHTHLLETRAEQRFSTSTHPAGAITALDQLGLVNERLLLAHCVWIDSAGRSALAEAGASVVTNPASNLRLHAGVAPIKAMIADGINIALGTDNMSLDGVDDLLAEARLMRALQRQPDDAGEPIDAATTLAMATRGGARALGRPDLGVIQPGSPADIVLIHADENLTGTTHVDVAELALATGRRQNIHAVIGAGTVLVRDGELAHPTEARLLSWPDPATRETVQGLQPFLREHYRADLT